MDQITYREAVERTWKKGETIQEDLSNMALGIAGEAGEIADSIKKVIHHGHILDREETIEEIGDLEYYLTQLKKYLKVSDEYIREMNIHKLKKRYPEGFSSEASINREI